MIVQRWQWPIAKTRFSKTLSWYCGKFRLSCHDVYLRETLRDFGYQQSAATGIFEDNLACITMSENPVRWKFSRHIDIRRYFVRELAKAGNLHWQLIPLCTHRKYAFARFYCASQSHVNTSPLSIQVSLIFRWLSLCFGGYRTYFEGGSLKPGIGSMREPYHKLYPGEGAERLLN